MPAASFTCPHCQAAYPLVSAMLGRKLRCKQCQGAIAINADGSVSKHNPSAVFEVPPSATAQAVPEHQAQPSTNANPTSPEAPAQAGSAPARRRKDRTERMQKALSDDLKHKLAASASRALQAVGGEPGPAGAAAAGTERIPKQAPPGKSPPGKTATGLANSGTRVAIDQPQSGLHRARQARLFKNLVLSVAAAALVWLVLWWVRRDTSPEGRFLQQLAALQEHNPGYPARHLVLSDVSWTNHDLQGEPWPIIINIQDGVVEDRNPLDLTPLARLRQEGWTLLAAYQLWLKSERLAEAEGVLTSAREALAAQQAAEQAAAGGPPPAPAPTDQQTDALPQLNSEQAKTALSTRRIEALSSQDLGQRLSEAGIPEAAIPGCLALALNAQRPPLPTQGLLCSVRIPSAHVLLVRATGYDLSASPQARLILLDGGEGYRMLSCQLQR